MGTTTIAAPTGLPQSAPSPHFAPSFRYYGPAPQAGRHSVVKLSRSFGIAFTPSGRTTSVRRLPIPVGLLPRAEVTNVARAAQAGGPASRLPRFPSPRHPAGWGTGRFCPPYGGAPATQRLPRFPFPETRIPHLVSRPFALLLQHRFQSLPVLPARVATSVLGHGGQPVSEGDRQSVSQECHQDASLYALLHLMINRTQLSSLFRVRKAASIRVRSTFPRALPAFLPSGSSRADSGRRFVPPSATSLFASER